MPELVQTEDALELSLSGSRDFQGDLAKAKAVPGRRYDGERKVWIFPNEPTVAERIMHTIRPSASPRVLKWVREARAAQAAELTTSIPEDAELRLPWAGELFAHQRSVIDWAAENPRCLIADDMGVGKTIEAIGAAEERLLNEQALWEAAADDLDATAAQLGERPERGFYLAVVPNATRGGWVKTAEGYLGGRRAWDGIGARVIDATKPGKRIEQLGDAMEHHQLAVMNWEKLRIPALLEAIIEAAPDAVFADEVQRAKNRKAKQALALAKLRTPMRLGLSGTPLMNSPDELWSILHWLYPEEYNRTGRNGAIAYWAFYDLYVEHYEGPWGRVITGVRNPDALRFALKGRLVRRTKAEVLDLPPKVRQRVPVELNPAQRRLYEDAERKLWIEVAEAAKAGSAQDQRLLEAAFNAPALIYQLPNGGSRMTRLRQIASTPATLGGEDDSVKLDAAVEIITDVQPKQFVVYSQFRETCVALKRRLEKHHIRAETFMGGDAHTELEEHFQAGDIDVLCCTIESGGVGITLTAADTVIFLERHWVPDINVQAEDRLHRQGAQKHDKITVLIIEAQDTVDVSKVRPANELKSMIVESVLQQDEVEEAECLTTK